MPNAYEYSIVRAIPNQLRGELVNIGLVVFLPDRLDVRLLGSWAKLRALDPNIDPDAFNDLPEVVNRLVGGVRQVEDQIRLIDQLGFFSLSDKGVFQISRQEEYERMLANLMEQLVSVPRHVEVADKAPQSRVSTLLREQFRRMGLLGKSGKDIDKKMVVPNFPISMERRLYADFAAKNGVWHFTETVDLRTSAQRVHDEKFGEAAVKAVTLDQAARLYGDEAKLSVVFAVSADLEKEAKPHLSILRDYAQGHVYNLEKPTEMNAFFSNISEALLQPDLH